MKTIIAMILKDYKLMIRDRMSAFFIFVFPLIFSLFFGAIYGGNNSSTPNVKIAILDNDASETSKKFATDLSSIEGITRVTVEGHKIEDYQEALKKKKTTVFIVLPKGFEERFNKPFGEQPLTVSMTTDPKQPESGMIVGGMMKQLASQRMQSMFNKDFTIPEDAPLEIKLALTTLKSAVNDVTKASGAGTPETTTEFVPIVVNEMALELDSKPAGFVLTLAQSSIWVCIGVVVAFISFIGVEATSGNLLRLSLSPFSKFRFLVAKALGAFIIQVAIMSVFFVGTWMYAPFVPNIFGLIVSISATAFAFSGFMIGISSLLDIRSKSVGGVVNSILLMLAMIGGAMIPLAFMPKWMLTISQFNPVYHAIYSMEAMTWRGLELGDIGISLLVLICVGAAGIALGMMKFSYVQGER